jgi:hypothetical protein
MVEEREEIEAEHAASVAARQNGEPE